MGFVDNRMFLFHNRLSFWHKLLIKEHNNIMVTIVVWRICLPWCFFVSHHHLRALWWSVFDDFTCVEGENWEQCADKQINTHTPTLSSACLTYLPLIAHTDGKPCTPHEGTWHGFVLNTKASSDSAFTSQTKQPPTWWVSPIPNTGNR